MPLKPALSADPLVEIEARLHDALTAVRKFRKLSKSVGIRKTIPFSIVTETAQTMDGSMDSLVEAAVMERIRTCFPSIGKGGASVLFQLLENAGEYVANKDLARDAGSRSANTKLVQVYICRIRSRLVELGMDGIIETGRHSYRMRQSSAPELIRHLFQG